MVRLTRAQAQERTRSGVLAAARAEFAAHGYRDARIDAIADRAGLTRGAVYSNFPGKRALYFAVLADDAVAASAARCRAGGAAHPPQDGGAAAALGRFARAWITRCSLTADPTSASTRLGADLLSEVRADERLRLAYAELTRLQAILLGLALEASEDRVEPVAGRRVRVAQTALTLLHGAGQLAAAAPGFVEPFDVVQACERLLDLDVGDSWRPPHLPHTPPVRPMDQPWSPPSATDLWNERPAHLDRDGVVVVLGGCRLGAIEEAVRAAPPAATVTAVVVDAGPAELLPLAELVISETRGLLRHAVAPGAWPAVQLVCDRDAAVAAAAGAREVGDETEVAVRIRAGRMVARAEGRGAGHSAASAGAGPGGP